MGNWECAVCQIRGNLLVVLMSTVRALLGQKQGTLHERLSKCLKMYFEVGNTKMYFEVGNKKIVPY